MSDQPADDLSFRDRLVQISFEMRDEKVLKTLTDEELTKELSWPLMLNAGNPNTFAAVLDMAREQGYRARITVDRKALEERESLLRLDVETESVPDKDWQLTPFQYIRPYEWPHMRLCDLSAEELAKGISGRFDGNFTLKEIKLLHREAGYREGRKEGQSDWQDR